MRLFPYAKLCVFNLMKTIELNNTNATIQLLKKYIPLFTALSNSNVGLVGDLAGATFYKSVLDELESNVKQITDPVTLHQMAQIIADHPIKVEWLLNSLSLEGYRIASFLRNRGYKELPSLKHRIIDSLGIWAPDFYIRKWFDPEETYYLYLEIWAQTIKNPLENNDKLYKKYL